MIYGNETMLLLADVGLKFEKADMQNFNSLTQHQLLFKLHALLQQQNVCTVTKKVCMLFSLDSLTKSY